MIVMKYGGTSVGDADRIAHVARLSLREPGEVVVVTSAMSGTTDALIGLGSAAERGDEDAVRDGLIALRERHDLAAIDDESRAAIARHVERLDALLRGILLLREQTPRSRAMLAAFGERLSAPLLAAAIRAQGRASVAVDATELVVTNANYLEAVVDEVATRHKTRARLLPLVEQGVLPVVTGFIGATIEGATTLLGRGGSDDSAALIGACLDAREVWIWTDVDGILSADPRVVPDPRVFSAVSYREAAEMSYFGAKVVHPKTMLRVDRYGIPLVIRSTFHPDHPGTRIIEEGDVVPLGVKTITSMRGLSLVTVSGRGLAGLRGAARRILGAAEASATNVVMISQASSEQAVSLVVRADDASGLVTALEDALALERASDLVDPVRIEPDVAVLSAVGDGMAGATGTSARLFGALGRTGVNVRAIAQGASERSISVAINDTDVVRAVRAVHAAFGLTVAVDLVLVGAGRVAQALLPMLAATRARLERERGLSLRIVAAASSQHAFVEGDGVASDAIITRLAAAPPRTDDAAWLDAIEAVRRGPVVLVDLTAADTSALHVAALDRGFHVVTANKRPLSGPSASWGALVEAVRRTGARYGYETTFGAGLPVLHTLKELLTTGDEIAEITGCLSGTLGYLCTRLDDGVSLAGAIEEAAAHGYTEPDPCEDLSGRDVARKALIIARAMGLVVEPEAVVCRPMLDGLANGLATALRDGAAALEAWAAQAAERGAVLRYVASIRADGIEVGLREVQLSSPEGSLRGPDNLLVFRTARYREHPLVVRGPGAGAEVTAAGVLGDIVRVVTTN